MAVLECGALIRPGIIFVSVCKKTLYVENHCIPFGQGSGLDWYILLTLPAFEPANIVF